MDSNSQVAVVTGASYGGIGYEVARGLAELGATVTIVARDRSRGDDAVKRISKDTGNGAVSLVLGDMGSLASIRSAAAELIAKARLMGRVTLGSAACWCVCWFSHPFTLAAISYPQNAHAPFPFSPAPSNPCSS